MLGHGTSVNSEVPHHELPLAWVSEVRASRRSMVGPPPSRWELSLKKEREEAEKRERTLKPRERARFPKAV